MSTNTDNRFIWLGGKIIRVGDAKINVLSPTAQFGLNVFEGIRCYWNSEVGQLYAFRLDDHLKRLKRSQRLIGMDNAFTVEELKKAFIDVIVANRYKENISVRQTLFIDGFGSWASSEKVNMFVAPIPSAKTNPEYNKNGLHCCVSSWRRIDDNSLSPRIKCGANYINSRMAQLEARRNGYDTAVFLNNDGKVAEGPGSCLFIIRDGRLVTPKITDSLLESITRDTLIRLARGLGYEVEERTVDRTELYMCNGAFLCGSAMELTPVLSIDRYPTDNPCAAEITKALHKEYLRTVTVKEGKYADWLTPIYEQ